MSHTLDDLRAHLFAQLERLNGNSGEEEIARAKAIAVISREVIATGKLEVEHARVTGNAPASGFIGESAPKLPKGVLGVKTHRLAG